MAWVIAVVGVFLMLIAATLAWRVFRPRWQAASDDPDAQRTGLAAQIADDNVEFTVYRPRRMPVNIWCSILAFAHLSEQRAGAPPGTPDPLKEVARQVEHVLGEQAASYGHTTQDSVAAIPRAGDLCFVLDVPDLEVNPRERRFRWVEDVHREEFRVRAAAALDGRTVRGWLHVYLGALIVADVALTMRIDAGASEPDTTSVEVDHGRPYRRVFPSYSRRDAAIVRQVRKHVRTLGDEYLLDVDHLRSGEVWPERLGDFIREADIFQLFWSHDSMRSPWVRQEWEYALSLGRPHFVRPTYWQIPMPEAPDENLPPPALLALHFERLPLDDERWFAGPIINETVPDPKDVRPAPPMSPSSRAHRRRSRRLPNMAIAALLLVGIAGTITWQFQSSPLPPQAAPAPAPQSPFRVTRIDLGNAIGADKKVTAPTLTFMPNDTIYASISSDGSAPVVAVAVRWTFEDGQLVNESTHTVAPTGPAVTEFHIAKPDGWPAGKYQVAVAVNGQPAGTVQFSVVD